MRDRDDLVARDGGGGGTAGGEKEGACEREGVTVQGAGRGEHSNPPYPNPVGGCRRVGDAWRAISVVWVDLQNLELYGRCIVNCICTSSLLFAAFQPFEAIPVLCRIASRVRSGILAAVATVAFTSFAPTLLAQRLPDTVRPEHYTLQLTPDLKAATFSGDETIDVTLAQAADSITLNAAEIQFQVGDGD